MELISFIEEIPMDFWPFDLKHFHLPFDLKNIHSPFPSQENRDMCKNPRFSRIYGAEKAKFRVFKARAEYDSEF